MIKSTKVVKDSKTGSIVMFVSNKIHSQDPNIIERQSNVLSSEEEKEIDDLDHIKAKSDCGYINDIKQECQNLSTDEIRLKVMSELTGNDIK